MSKRTHSETAADRLTEADLVARGYIHIVIGSLRFDERSQRNVVKIRTFGPDAKYDGGTRWIATSDLHQCAWQAKRKDEISMVTRRVIRGKLQTESAH